MAVEVVVAHGDLFQHDFLFGVEFFLRERRADHVGQQFDLLVDIGAADPAEVERVFAAGEGVVVSAHVVEVDGDLPPGAFAGALEAHVFEEVADAGPGGGLVAAAGPGHEAGGGAADVVHRFDDDPKAAIQPGIDDLAHIASGYAAHTVKLSRSGSDNQERT